MFGSIALSGFALLEHCKPKAVTLEMTQPEMFVQLEAVVLNSFLQKKLKLLQVTNLRQIKIWLRFEARLENLKVYHGQQPDEPEQIIYAQGVLLAIHDYWFSEDSVGILSHENQYDDNRAVS